MSVNDSEIYVPFNEDPEFSFNRLMDEIDVGHFWQYDLVLLHRYFTFIDSICKNPEAEGITKYFVECKREDFFEGKQVCRIPFPNSANLEKMLRYLEKHELVSIKEITNGTDWSYKLTAKGALLFSLWSLKKEFPTKEEFLNGDYNKGE